MQIQIDMNTINKYIHAQEATVTKANPYIETDELSTKAKSLLVKLVERGFYFKIPTTTLNTLKEELGGELVGELTSNNDVAVITEDTPVNGDVSTNDSTTSTGTLTFAKTTDPIHGTVLFNSNGTYTYTPNSNFNGTDSFTYTVTDSALGESKVNTVTITVNPVSDLVVNDITATIQEDTVLNSTITGTTASGGVLSYTKTTDPVHGVAVVNMDGSYTYTPETNYHGTDSFTFTVVDSNANESLTGSITITITPVVDLTAADVSVSTDEDVMFTGSLTTEASTTSGGTLTFTKVNDPLNGVAVVNSNGDYTYTPNSNYSGIDSFDYSVTDSVTLESLTKTVTITINEVSDLTVTAVIATVSEDAVLNSTVATNASTTSGNTLSFSKATDPVNGTVTINADGTFEYTPASNYNGTDTFDFITTDSVTGETQTKPVIITVTAIGDLEVQAYTNTMVQDTVLEGTLVGVATTTSGGVLEYSKATDPVNGAVVVNTDGTFTYTPTASYVGEDTFDFTVTDEDAGETRIETATITIETITPAPVVLPVTYNILKTGNTLVVTFSEAVKYNGFPLEDYTGTVIDFIKNTSQPNQSLSLFDQTIDETKLVLTTTATSYTLTLEPNFFNKNIFKALDDSFVGGPDEWAGNEDGFYRIDFLFKPEAFTSLTDVVVPANTSNPTVDELKITVYTTASETVTQHTAEDYENSDILGVFDNIPVYPTP